MSLFCVSKGDQGIVEMWGWILLREISLSPRSPYPPSYTGAHAIVKDPWVIVMRHVVSYSMLAAVFLTPACNARSYQLLEQAESRWREGNYEDAVRLNQLLHDRD